MLNIGIQHGTIISSLLTGVVKDYAIADSFCYAAQSP